MSIRRLHGNDARMLFSRDTGLFSLNNKPVRSFDCRVRSELGPVNSKETGKITASRILKPLSQNRD